MNCQRIISWIFISYFLKRRLVSGKDRTGLVVGSLSINAEFTKQ